MVHKTILSKTDEKYIAAFKLFEEGTYKDTEIASEVGVARQTISRWKKKWKIVFNTADSEKITTIKNDIVYKGKSVEHIKEEHDQVDNIKNKAVSILDTTFTKITVILEKENALTNPRDIQNLTKLIGAIAPYVMDKKDNGSEEPQGNNFFFGEFELHQTIKQIPNGQPDKLIDIGHTEE